MEVRISTKPMPCRCDEYDFPHRTGGGACRMREPSNPGVDYADHGTSARRDSYIPTFSWHDMGLGASQ